MSDLITLTQLCTKTPRYSGRAVYEQRFKLEPACPQAAVQRVTIYECGVWARRLQRLPFLDGFFVQSPLTLALSHLGEGISW